MSACRSRGHREAGRWLVMNRRCNYSAFNGYRWAPSDYSLVWCGACNTAWRTKAGYVDELRDASREE